jgi:hypothetical protein
MEQFYEVFKDERLYDVCIINGTSCDESIAFVINYWSEITDDLDKDNITLETFDIIEDLFIKKKKEISKYIEDNKEQLSGFKNVYSIAYPQIPHKK